MKAIAHQIHEAALAANWSAPTARWLPFFAADLAGAQQIIAHAKQLPEHIRELLLRNARAHMQTGAQVMSAFHEADDIRKYVDIGGPTLPDTFRNMRAFVKDGERLMSVAEVRGKIIRALAEMDVHIDTTRRVEAAPQATGSFKATADAFWAAQKGGTQ